MTSILFLCSGNTCRSPMAEAIARHWLESRYPKEKSQIQVLSAGVRAHKDNPTSPETVNALAARGIDFQGRSQRLTPELIEYADVIYGMTQEHLEAAQSMLQAGDRDCLPIILAIEPQAEIEDPLGQGQAAYDKIADEFICLIPKRLEQIRLSSQAQE